MAGVIIWTLEEYNEAKKTLNDALATLQTLSLLSNSNESIRLETTCEAIINHLHFMEQIPISENK